MVRIPQIRGMLLEETILYLIVVCGYDPVNDYKNDKTLYLRKQDKALCVRGRGEKHQIDAIADFFLSPPFSHKHRLLIEAKQHNDKIGLPDVRNIVGVLKDVAEFWTASNLGVNRYHYQYAMISGSGFTAEAEKYAFVQDIYLLPVHRSKYFRNLLQSIKDVSNSSFGVRDENSNIEVNLNELRVAIRQRIPNPEDDKLSKIKIRREAREALDRVCQECSKIKVGLLATINGDFPLFLVPNPSRLVELAESSIDGELSSNNIHIYSAEGGGWIIQHRGEDFFSFDVPTSMFRLYMKQAPSQTGSTVDIQGLLMNLGRRVNSNLGNGIVKVNFTLPRTELDQLSKE
jgi:hypothetical protein